jgi:hypothetical protein
MAVHDDVEGIEVAVCVDGQALKEYKTDNDPAVRFHEDTCTVTNYIEAVTGKNFTFKLAINSSYNATSPNLNFEIAVNGKVVAGYCKKVPVKQTWEMVVQGVTSGKTGPNGTLQKFVFSQLRTCKVFPSVMVYTTY